MLDSSDGHFVTTYKAIITAISISSHRFIISHCGFDLAAAANITTAAVVIRIKAITLTSFFILSNYSITLYLHNDILL